jgi:FkbM family methyltransferase
MILIQDDGYHENLNPTHFFAPKEMLDYGYIRNGSIAERRVPEHEIIEWVFDNFITIDKTFVDIGAHIGTYSWILGTQSKKVYAFEPTKSIYNILCANIALHNLSSKTEAHQVALSSQRKKMTFFENSEDGGTNGLMACNDYIDKYEIEVKTLDDYNIENIGIIKIDVEGHELEVLRGATQTLRNNGYPPLLFECWDNPNWKDPLWSFLKELDYVIENVGNSKEMFIAHKEKLNV